MGLARRYRIIPISVELLIEWMSDWEKPSGVRISSDVPEDLQIINVSMSVYSPFQIDLLCWSSTFDEVQPEEKIPKWAPIVTRYLEEEIPEKAIEHFVEEVVGDKTSISRNYFNELKRKANLWDWHESPDRMGK